MTWKPFPAERKKGKDSFAYLTRRIDHIFEKNTVKLLAMEDFCQLDLRLTQDKYKGSYERCAKIVNQTCGISRNSAEKMVAKVISMKDTYLSMCTESLLPFHLKESFITLIQERIQVLENK